MTTTDDPQRDPRVSFDTEPGSYRHWRLDVDGEIADLRLDVDEDGGLVPGYELKMNSYDLGVDIELYDAMQRLRFEHPEVRAVVVTSAKDRKLLRGREHPDARPVAAPVEGELLQVHQRDPQRHRGRHAPTPARPTSPRSTAPRPAAATSSRWPATRSC